MNTCEKNVCSLCEDKLLDSRILPCFHHFCLKCLKANFKQQIEVKKELNCPECSELFAVPKGGLTDLAKLSTLKVKTCPLCEDELLNSRILPCFHTFCLRCLKTKFKEDLVSKTELNCPECDSAFNVPYGGLLNLKNNEFVELLNEVTNKLINKNKKDDKIMCEMHNLVSDIYCELCKCSICQLCLFGDHNAHRYKPLKEFVALSKAKLEEINKGKEIKCQEIDEELKNIENKISSFKNTASSVKEKLKDRADELKRLIDNHVKEMFVIVDDNISIYEKKANSVEVKLSNCKKSLENEINETSTLLKEMNARKALQIPSENVQETVKIPSFNSSSEISFVPSQDWETSSYDLFGSLTFDSPKYCGEVMLSHDPQCLAVDNLYLYAAVKRMGTIFKYCLDDYSYVSSFPIEDCNLVSDMQYRDGHLYATVNDFYRKPELLSIDLQKVVESYVSDDIDNFFPYEAFASLDEYYQAESDDDYRIDSDENERFESDEDDYEPKSDNSDDEGGSDKGDHSDSNRESAISSIIYPIMYQFATLSSTNDTSHLLLNNRSDLSLVDLKHLKEQKIPIPPGIDRIKHAVKINNNNVCLVCELENKVRVCLINDQGNILKKYKSPCDEWNITDAAYITADNFGRLYIPEPKQNKIMVLDRNLNYLTSFEVDDRPARIYYDKFRDIIMVTFIKSNRVEFFKV